MPDITKFNTKDYVAHYTKLDTVVKYILPSNKIKVGNIKNVNDPYENKINWFDINFKDENKYEGINSQAEEHQKLKSILSESIKIFASTDYEEIKNSAGLSGHIYCRPRMWAQYGDDHKGICLIFNKEKLNSCFKNLPNIVKIYSDKVEYLEWLDTINSSSKDVEYEEVEEYINDKNKLFEAISENSFFEFKFFRKHYDWKNENEYRWLIISRERRDLFVNFEDSLEAIVLGCDVCPEYSELFKYKEVPVYYLQFIDEYKANKVIDKKKKTNLIKSLFYRLFIFLYLFFKK